MANQLQMIDFIVINNTDRSIFQKNVLETIQKYNGRNIEVKTVYKVETLQYLKSYIAFIEIYEKTKV